MCGGSKTDQRGQADSMASFDHAVLTQLPRAWVDKRSP